MLLFTAMPNRYGIEAVLLVCYGRPRRRPKAGYESWADPPSVV